MANNPKITTQLGELAWVFISGLGVLKMNASDSPENYLYKASCIMNAEDAKVFRAKVMEYYNEETKDKYTLLPSFLKPCDKDGRIKDEAGNRIPEAGAEFFIAEFTTSTRWKRKDDETIGKAKEVYVLNHKREDITASITEGIGNGTHGVVGGTMYYWKREASGDKPAEDGIKLGLISVQIKPSTLKAKLSDPGYEVMDDDEVMESDDEGGGAGTGQTDKTAVPM